MKFRLENVQGLTHIGNKRKRNEDRYLIHSLKDGAAVLLAVADGMGGAAGGDIAAQTVIDTLKEYQHPGNNIEQDLTGLLHWAGAKIADMSRTVPKLEDMGTTATVVLVTAARRAYWAHVGDSRLYVLQKGRIEQITTDHTFVQDLIQDGTLSRADAERHPLKNMLDQCVGCRELKPDSGSFSLDSGLKILLCSDGLNLHVSDEAINEAFDGRDIRDIADRLVQSALAAGANDNVTVVIMK